MSGSKAIQSSKDLLELPQIKAAKCLELSICDIIHFRLIQPEGIFHLVGKYLEARHPNKFSQFAERRLKVDRDHYGSSIRDKIDACCTQNPEWIRDRDILLSTELEVWMELSYPNLWALDLYHEAMVQGKEILVRNVGPFTEAFTQALKEKNGYERTLMHATNGEAVAVHIGEQTWLKSPYLHLVTDKRQAHDLPFGETKDLAGRLAYGIMLKDLDDQSARDLDDEQFRAHAMGFQLIGPTLLLLIQSLENTLEAVSFTGRAAASLSQLVESVRPFWGRLPEIVPPDNAKTHISLLPEEQSEYSVFPGRGTPSLITLEEDGFQELFLPGVELLLKAAFQGPDADVIRAAALEFVYQFAQASRGLHLPIEPEPVLDYWSEWVLSPWDNLVNWLAKSKRLPGFSPEKSSVKDLRSGPWPTLSYRLSGNLKRRWMNFRDKERVSLIEEAMEAKRSGSA